MALVKRDRKASDVLLDEETYEYFQSLNKISQRDFFPELPKLRAQHEYLDAVEHNDLEKLREISARYQVSHTPSGSSRLDNEYGYYNSGLEDFKSKFNSLRTRNRPFEDYCSLDAFEDDDSEKQPKKSPRYQVSHTSSGSSRLENEYGCYNSGLEDFKSTFNSLRTHKSPFEDYRSLDAFEHDDSEKQPKKSPRYQVSHTSSRSSRLDNKYGCSTSGLEDFKSNILWTQSSPYIEDYSSLFLKTTPPSSVIDASSIMTLGSKEETSFCWDSGYTPTGIPTIVSSKSQSAIYSKRGTPFRLDSSNTSITGTPGSSFKVLERKKSLLNSVSMSEALENSSASITLSRSPKYINSVEHPRKILSLQPDLYKLLDIRTEAVKFSPCPNWEGIIILLIFVLFVLIIAYILYKWISSAFKQKKSEWERESF